MQKSAGMPGKRSGKLPPAFLGFFYQSIPKKNIIACGSVQNFSSSQAHRDQFFAPGEIIRNYFGSWYPLLLSDEETNRQILVLKKKGRVIDPPRGAPRRIAAFITIGGAKESPSSCSLTPVSVGESLSREGWEHGENDPLN
jgi:hypothetical protein